MRNESIETIKQQFSKKRIIVIGDLMVDEYVKGRVKRISPEAPVAVLDYECMSRTAGGASNVAKNVCTLGARVQVIGVAAEDEAGCWLREDLAQMGIHTEGIFSDQRPTIVKTRYATKGQQLLRVDHEVCRDISEQVKTRILDMLREMIGSTDAVILSDYCKGLFADDAFVRELIAICQVHQIFVLIDSKRKELGCFEHADIVKPNNLELEAATGVQIVDDASLNSAGSIYLEKSGAKLLMVTRGAQGISVFERGKRRMDFSADRAAQVYDVTGAGDTVISTVSLALVSGMPVSDAMELANIAAGIVISSVGTVAIRWEELVDRLEKRLVG